MVEGNINIVHWEASFRKKVKRLTAKNSHIGYHERYALLETLAPSLGKKEFLYKTESDKITGCTSLLQCCNYLLDHVDGSTFKDRKLYFSSIISILHRREFDVDVLQITQGNGGLYFSCSQSILNIICEYRTLLYRIQYYCNCKMKAKGIYSMLTSFCMAITAISYCFIGNITSTILAAIGPTREAENTRVQTILNDLLATQTEIETQLDPFQSRGIQVFCHFKWALCEIPKSEEFLVLEKKVLSNPNWVKIFTSDPVSRYRFISELVSYASHISRNEPIQWCLLSGYFDILYPFFDTVLKETPHLSKNVVALSKTLLYNINIFNVFLTISLTSTNLYDSVATNNTIQRIGDWFTSCRLKHSTLHLPEENINFDLIHKAFSILLLDNDHFSTLLSSLIFIYNHLSYFPPQRRDDIITQIFLNNFYRFFLHWNSDVRVVFHHIIVFKIFAFEVFGGSLNNKNITRIYRRTLVTDSNHFEAVKNKIQIIQTLMSRPQKAGLDPAFRLLMPYADASFGGYRSALEFYTKWREDIQLRQDGSIIYPIIECHATPDA